MSLTSWTVRFVTGRAAGRFEAATKEPVPVQQEKLLSLVRRNAGTDYGRRHGFEKIRSIRDYQRQVPVVNYEDIRADVDRVVAGESGVLTAEDPVMFAQTSGTTGEPKRIPVTPTCQGQDHRDVMHTWLCHAQRDHPGIFTGKVISMVSPAVEGRTDRGVPFGSTSGDMYRRQPWIIRRAYPIPYRAFEIDSYQSKYYALMRLAMEQDVHFLCTANPSSVLKLCEKADEFGESILRDIHDGTLSADVQMERDIRTEIEAGLRRNPGRAKALDDHRSHRGGKMLPADYWPDLALIACWKGGTVGHYLEHFAQWFDPDGDAPVPVRDWGYLSSEGRCSIPLSDQGSQGALTVATNFFEFVEVEELEGNQGAPESWRFLTVGELEDGREYYIFLTTSGGLYRYDINDIIRVVGKHNQTPQVVFVRKGRGMTNITGEKVSVNQVIDVFHQAAAEVGAIPSHFRAEADPEKSRYTFLVEFATKTEPVLQRQLLECLDTRLKAINIEYKSKRDSLRLRPPVMKVMREGWYERGCRFRAESGSRVFQAKTILLCTKGESETAEPSAGVEVERVVRMSE